MVTCFLGRDLRREVLDLLSGLLLVVLRLGDDFPQHLIVQLEHFLLGLRGVVLGLRKVNAMTMM